MSGSSGSSGGDHRHQGRNVRGRPNVRLQQFLPNVPVLAAAVPVPAPPQLPPVAPEPDLELNLELPPPALPPQPLYAPVGVGDDPVVPDFPPPFPELNLELPPPQPLYAPVGVGDDPVVPDFPPPFPEHQPNPPPVYLDILGFPQLPELPVLDDDDDNDNQGGYRHMFKKRLSNSDIDAELNITGQNLEFFCYYLGQNNLLDNDNKCIARLSVLLRGVMIDGDVSLRVGGLRNEARLTWKPVLGEHAVELQLRQQVFAWFKRMELDGRLRIVIQVVEP